MGYPAHTCATSLGDLKFEPLLTASPKLWGQCARVREVCQGQNKVHCIKGTLMQFHGVRNHSQSINNGVGPPYCTLFYINKKVSWNCSKNDSTSEWTKNVHRNFVKWRWQLLQLSSRKRTKAAIKSVKIQFCPTFASSSDNSIFSCHSSKLFRFVALLYSLPTK